MANQLEQTLQTSQYISASKSATQEFLTFTVDQEEYGVDIMTVHEIKGWTEVTRLPNTPDYMRGVINLRGLIVPIFDLRTRFHHGLTHATPKHVVIILAIGERTIGLLVDAVSDILTVDSNQIKPAPEEETPVNHASTRGLIALENRMVILLDMVKLFDAKHTDAAAADLHGAHTTDSQATTHEDRHV